MDLPLLPGRGHQEGSREIDLRVREAAIVRWKEPSEQPEDHWGRGHCGLSIIAFFLRKTPEPRHFFNQVEEYLGGICPMMLGEANNQEV